MKIDLCVVKYDNNDHDHHDDHLRIEDEKIEEITEKTNRKKALLSKLMLKKRKPGLG